MVPQRSTPQFRYAAELVRNGRIGQLKTVEVGLPGDPSGDEEPVMLPLSGTPTFEICRTGARLELLHVSSLGPEGTIPAIEAVHAR